MLYEDYIHHIEKANLALAKKIKKAKDKDRPELEKEWQEDTVAGFAHYVTTIPEQPLLNDLYDIQKRICKLEKISTCCTDMS